MRTCLTIIPHAAVQLRTLRRTNEVKVTPSFLARLASGRDHCAPSASLRNGTRINSEHQHRVMPGPCHPTPGRVSCNHAKAFNRQTAGPRSG